MGRPTKLGKRRKAIALTGSIAIDRIEIQLTDLQRGEMLDVALQGMIKALPPMMGIHNKRSIFNPVIDRGDDALTAVNGHQLTHKVGVTRQCRIEQQLVGPVAHQSLGVGEATDAAPEHQGHEAITTHLGDSSTKGGTIALITTDIENHQFVDGRGDRSKGVVVLQPVEITHPLQTKVAAEVETSLLVKQREDQALLGH